MPRPAIALVFCLLAVLTHAQPAAANMWRCFGPENQWCAWTVRESQPEMGWGVVNKVRLPGLIVETVIDAQHNIPMLRLKVAPVPDYEDVRVFLSLRQGRAQPEQWRGFVGVTERRDDGTAYFKLSRRALETVIEAPESAKLYVFVELRSKTTNHKSSHKVGLDGLDEALRFARLGR